MAPRVLILITTVKLFRARSGLPRVEIHETFIVPPVATDQDCLHNNGCEALS
jgi:hypothetical protein